MIALYIKHIRHSIPMHSNYKRNENPLKSTVEEIFCTLDEDAMTHTICKVN
jgi:hypothetical protein